MIINNRFMPINEEASLQIFLKFVFLFFNICVENKDKRLYTQNENTKTGIKIYDYKTIENRPGTV